MNIYWKDGARTRIVFNREWQTTPDFRPAESNPEPTIELAGTITPDVARAILFLCDKRGLLVGEVVERAVLMYATATDLERLNAALRSFSLDSTILGPASDTAEGEEPA